MLTAKSAEMVDAYDEGKEAASVATYFSACAKCLAADSAFAAAANAVQIFGGNGVNAEFPGSRAYRFSSTLVTKE